MQLCDKDLREVIRTGDLIILGIEENFPFIGNSQIQPASIDLRLGTRFVRFKNDIKELDTKNLKFQEENVQEIFVTKEEGIWLQPKEIIYAQVYELIEISNKFSARIKGKTRIARLGISIFATGDYINPGFSGAMPLQIINHNHFAIKLYPYMEICQLVVYRISNTPLVDYSTFTALKDGYQHEETVGLPRGLVEPSENKLIKRKIEKIIQDYEDRQEKELPELKNEKEKDKIINNYMNMNINIDTKIDNRCNINIVLEGLEKVDKYLSERKYEDYQELQLELENLKEALKEKKENESKRIIKNIGKALLDVAKSVGSTALIEWIRQNI
ncbi:MAG: dCTP deaminase [Eubacteriales bacterium]|nr:dCTP deaminase [Eubacteriales bacterium]